MRYLITGNYTVWPKNGGQGFTNTANFTVEAEDPAAAKAAAVKMIVVIYPDKDLDTNFTAKPA